MNSPTLPGDKRWEAFDKVNAETRKFDCDDLLTRLLAADIWCVQVHDRKASEDQAAVHGKMITTYEHLNAGTVKVIAPAVMS